MNYKMAPLLLTSGQKAKSTLEVHISQPDGQKEELAGRIFAIIEIESRKSDDYDLINFLIDELNQNYYNNEKLVLREKISTLKIEHIFESALVKTNKDLAEFFKNKNLSFDPESFNATIGVIFNNEIHFANIGKNRVFLFYKNKKDGQYSLVDILEKTKGKDEIEEQNISKLLHNIVSGTIPDDGYFVATNEALPEYLSGRQFIDFVTTLPPVSAAEQIKNTLSAINSYISFSAVIIKNTVGNFKFQDIPDDTKIQPSINTPAISYMEKNTEKLLSPSGMLNVKNRFSLAGIIEKIKPSSLSGMKPGKMARPNDNILNLKDKIFFNRQSYLKSLQKIYSYAKDIVIYIINALIFIVKHIVNIKKYLPNIKAAILNSGKLIISLGGKIKNLKLSHKIYISVILLCFIVLGINSLFLNKKNQDTKTTEQYNSITQQIEQKQNQVDASLVYKDDARAKKLFTEIKELMAQLPKDNQAQQSLLEKFNAKLNEQIAQINKAVQASTTEIANLSSQGANINPTQLALLSGNRQIYALDNNSKSIFIVNLKDNTVKSLPIDDKIIGQLSNPVVDKNQNIFFFKSESLVKLETATSKFSTLNISKPVGLLTAAALAEFNNRVYLLDQKDNQIYKFEKFDQNNLAGSAWLKETVDLAGIKSIAIDGKIYALANNQISLFANGKKDTFKMDEVLPPMVSATNLIVSEDTNDIFVLEPANKRVLHITKSGTLRAQYVSEKFTDMRDFILDEANKKIYVLNGNSLFAFNITLEK